MQIKTILNRVQKYQSFIYTDFKLKEDKQLKLDITIRPRSNSRPICSGCGHKRPGYDTLPVRRFEFIPFWGVLVYFVYAMRSRIEPMKKVASMLRRHRELILNWFRAKKAFSSGIVEGLNAKAKVTTRKSYGFKSFKTLELALYHNLGALPQPIETHEFF